MLYLIWDQPLLFISSANLFAMSLTSCLSSFSIFAPIFKFKTSKSFEEQIKEELEMFVLKQLQ